MPAGFPAYPGPWEAEEGETYTYETPDGDAVAATVTGKRETEDGGIVVSLTNRGGDS